MNEIRTVFMGSPEFALTILQSLVGKVNLVGVVTQPDRPAGRGKVLTAPPVKRLAQEIGIPVLQPERLRNPDSFAQLQAWQPDLIIVAAFGQILRQNILELPKFGCINVHASLLPCWRGAAPIQAAILHGDKETGVTIMQMDAGVDTGGILAQQTVPILDEDDAASLSSSLAIAGAKLLLDSLPGILAGTIQPVQQNHELATYAPMIKKEDGFLDFTTPAQALARKVRAFTPWPGTSMRWDGQNLKVIRAKAMSGSKILPGQRGIVDGLPVIGTSDGMLALLEVQPPGKKAMPGKVFLNGARNWENISIRSN
ncbi:MAG: methionyl-tRNA formyltransferase [Bellilinea sp.]